MEITEVRIKLMDDPHDRLQAFCSITFDGCFVIRDLKIIQGTRGSFVAMPSRKLTDRCPKCHNKNHLRAMHCNQCGARLDDERATRDGDGRAKLYADIAHPINSDCRDMIQAGVLKAYEDELERSKLPGYVCTYDDYGEENYATLYEEEPLPRIVASADGSRRIEPASAPAGPHRSAAQARPQGASASSQMASRGAHDDKFGEGLI
ncbi:MAG: SpoVG family protein [Planctomycetes bacterium]|nr:SpoVG family protein [Planctomycetota bacterium]